MDDSSKVPPNPRILLPFRGLLRPCQAHSLLARPPAFTVPSAPPLRVRHSWPAPCARIAPKYSARRSAFSCEGPDGPGQNSSGLRHGSTDGKLAAPLQPAAAQLLRPPGGGRERRGRRVRGLDAPFRPEWLVLPGGGARALGRRDRAQEWRWPFKQSAQSLSAPPGLPSHRVQLSSLGHAPRGA